MNKVSVIVPVYNSARTLNRCVDSIIKQSYANIEVILINDGSTDNSQMIIDYYCKSDSRVIGICKNNGGVSSARNAGLESSSGDFVTFVDSDDYCEIDFVKNLVELIIKYDVDMASCGIIQENYHGIELRKLTNKPSVFKGELEVGQAVSCINKSFVYGKLYRNGLIKKNHLLFDEKLSMGEDTLFVSSYLCILEKGIATISQCPYHYVDANINSLSKKYYGNLEEVYGKIYDKDVELSKKYFSYKILYPREKLITTMEIQNLYSENCPFERKEKIRFIKRKMNNKNIRNIFIHSKALGLTDVIRKIAFYLRTPNLLNLFYLIGIKLKRCKIIYSARLIKSKLF